MQLTFFPYRTILIMRQGKKNSRSAVKGGGRGWGGVVANSKFPCGEKIARTHGGVDHPNMGWNVDQVTLHLIRIPYNHSNERKNVVAMVRRSSAAG